ncbi:MAG: shikimate kinase [Clostridia bacterium]|nr:shikimate kinase [Clostridia bacterium]
MMFESNITFIGMPGAGKSTVGVVVAKLLCKTFIDVDLLIQNREGKRLHKIIDEIGNDGFLKLENDTIANLNVHNSVISTGGSAIFGKEAMEHLKKTSTVVYIKVSYETLEKRLKSLKRRGVIFEEGQTLRDIYEIRTPLYEKYADYVIESNNDSDIQEVAMKIVEYFEQ